MDSTSSPPTVVALGENPVKLWGLTMGERVGRIARAASLVPSGTVPAGPAILSNAAHAWDPAWFRHIVSQPGMVLTLGGVPALAHGADAGQTARIAEAMTANAPLADTAGLTVVAFESGPTIENKQLRKRETPFLMALTPGSVRAIERASYFGAYKGVTDLLTKYLWPEWALVLTRICAKLHVTPNMVTAVGAAFCVIATVLFAYGHYWAGMATGLVFMVLDTVDGKLARCTITSSYWGNIFDHGMDLVHPPFWWWFWATGLAAWGLGYDSETFWLVQAAIQGGYVVQRVIEGVFMRQNGMMHIHVWRRFDSNFRLITARRNPNMVILFVAMVFSRPDLGLIAVAWWTVFSCLVHAVRLVQAWIVRARGGTITSWLSEA
ncbi:CDP-alcohol phosphatidyltransferase family protein [Novosphingobium mangrovi (ex Huang et al. 2023)]|uniref:CDP-alcohol phosphatidyltransferase family protein n=1 Tax=Novosphingobium mangrovi (ex Huang et al. 2023) TaxID=2976432 RepID=A0ABT2I191_9SPHN|nr:CDP-alcohol phosphatidyltransferase family protein [Novosphingobium mangrovi (ex Huang et al. 2023)]MCT2398573.1 CDP-alcohol phosphatidyltransferase family protein [Novosphingobium mangrovi (ex Huang et al. 2023)]